MIHFMIIYPVCQGSDCKLVTASMQQLMIVCLLDQSALVTVALQKLMAAQRKTTEESREASKKLARKQQVPLNKGDCIEGKCKCWALFCCKKKLKKT